MSFGYKTSWLATRSATPERVADVLGLEHRVDLDWRSGTDAAYTHGVYVARPVPDWTIAHSPIHLSPGLDVTDPEFADWLLRVGAEFGDMQFFTTDRIGDWHGWARVDDGRLTRAYCFVGDRGEVPLHLGERTEAEVELGVGERWLEDGWRDWREPEWEAWFAAMPREFHVMEVARRWGLCPLDIQDESVAGTGIYGMPPAAAPRRDL
jgi:hypothetical protein